MFRSNRECSFMFCRTYNSLTVNANCSLMLNMVKCLESVSWQPYTVKSLQANVTVNMEPMAKHCSNCLCLHHSEWFLAINFQLLWIIIKIGGPMTARILEYPGQATWTDNGMPVCSLLPQAIHSRGRIPSFLGINSMCNHVNYVTLLVTEYSAINGLGKVWNVLKNDLTSCLKDRMIMSEMGKTWRKVWSTEYREVFCKA